MKKRKINKAEGVGFCVWCEKNEGIYYISTPTSPREYLICEVCLGLLNKFLDNLGFIARGNEKNEK